MSLIGVLGRLLRPPVCLACGRPGGWPCCARCLPPEPEVLGPWPLATDPEVAVWALGSYGDGLRAAVLAGKLDGQAAALAELGRRLGVALAAAGIGADLVTWVAAGRVAGLPRDHAERIAAGVAGALDLPLAGLLAPARGRDLGRARRARRPVPAGRRHARHRRPAAAWPAAGSCSSTTWPPPAAPSPAPPPPSAAPAPTRSRPPCLPPPRPPSGSAGRAAPAVAGLSRGRRMTGICPAHTGRIVWL
jgi:hypothetical protein